MADGKVARGALAGGAYVPGGGGRRGGGWPVGVAKAIGIALAALIAIGGLGYGAWRLLDREPQQDVPTGVDAQGQEGTGDEHGADAQQPSSSSETVTDLDEDDGDAPEEDSEWAREREAHMHDNSASIPPEQKSVNLADVDIDDGTEERYSLYGALDIDRMRQAAGDFTAEWIQMVNDDEYDEHTELLKTLINQDYVRKEHEGDASSLLYMCLEDALYLPTGSMAYDSVSNVRIVNSVPSPLAYARVSCTAHIMTEDGGSELTVVSYDVAMDKDYMICEFRPTL